MPPHHPTCTALSFNWRFCPTVQSWLVLFKMAQRFLPRARRSCSFRRPRFEMVWKSRGGGSPNTGQSDDDGYAERGGEQKVQRRRGRGAETHRCQMRPVMAAGVRQALPRAMGAHRRQATVLRPASASASAAGVPRLDGSQEASRARETGAVPMPYSTPLT